MDRFSKMMGRVDSARLSKKEGKQNVHGENQQGPGWARLQPRGIWPYGHDKGGDTTQMLLLPKAM